MQAMREAEMEKEREIAAAKRIAMWWSRMNGSFAAKLKARAQMEMMKEEEAQHAAARRIQAMWRIRQGGLAAELKRRAK